MKKLFTSIFALTFALAGFNALAENASPDAMPEAKAAPATVEAPAPEPAPAVSNVVVPQAIADHLALRFPGYEVQGITREGVTYVVDLGNGLDIPYDNCLTPV